MSYSRDIARSTLATFRQKRRSATPSLTAAACEALGFRIDKSRGKGSHWVAIRSGTAPITIPTGHKTLGLKTATSILRRLEEILDDDTSTNH